MVYNWVHQTRVYGELKVILKRLSQAYRTGIVTSSPKKYASRLITYHDLDIDILSAYHDTRRHKPDPDPILNAISIIESKPDECIYIGDEVNDIIASKIAGVKSAVASWGSESIIQI